MTNGKEIEKNQIIISYENNNNALIKIKKPINDNRSDQKNNKKSTVLKIELSPTNMQMASTRVNEFSNFNTTFDKLIDFN
jgi:hypothetical protein